MKTRFFLAAMIATGLGVAPTVFAQDAMKPAMLKDKMDKKADVMSKETDKMKKTDGMMDKKDSMSKDNMKK